MKEAELIELIKGWQNKEPQATQVLMGIAYLKIKELAQKHSEKIPENANTAFLSYSATDLAHDVYVRLTKVESTLPIETLREFYSYLNATVRNCLIDNYRKLVEASSKNPEKTRLTSANALAQKGDDIAYTSELSSLSIHIKALAKVYPRQSESIELRYFAQRSNKEIARLQGVSIRTVENDLRFAKAWLKQKI